MIASRANMRQATARAPGLRAPLAPRGCSFRPSGGLSSRAAATPRGDAHLHRQLLQQQPQQRRQSQWRAAAVEGGAEAAPPASIQYDLDDLDNAKSAIDLGQAMCGEGRWQDALVIFEKALTLPGTGLKRFRDKPRLISDGEKCAALFNVACCHSRLGDVQSGLVTLAKCLESGYDNYAQIRADPDLETIRADERFQQLMSRFERKSSGGLFGGMFGGNK